jgi:hypothetical protein
MCRIRIRERALLQALNTPKNGILRTIPGGDLLEQCGRNENGSNCMETLSAGVRKLQ